MAKKRPDLEDVFASTERSKPGEKRELGRTISIGVGLKEGEVAELDDIAESTDFSRNAIMAWIIRRFLRQYREGEIEIPIEERTTKTLGDP